MQRLSAETRAILLLCGHFSPAPHGSKPLTPAEFRRLNNWLAARQMTPGQLLQSDLPETLQRITGIKIAAHRLTSLFSRVEELERALEAWGNAGIWVISVSERGFPGCLRQRLKSAVSPLLFGAGDPDRLCRGGVCVIGSRDSRPDGLAFARLMGRRCGEAAMTVISSDMRGVDREAISTTLAVGGSVVSVVSDSLIKAVSAKRNRGPLADGAMTMVTPFSPDTRFTVANAMRINKYQYALSDVAVIVETRRRGGIWSGAEENRSEGWVPAFVRSGKTVSQGNLALLHLGYQPITQEEVAACADIRKYFIDRRHSATAPMATQAGADLYAQFLAELLNIAAEPLSAPEVAAHFRIEEVQARAWLDRAVSEGHMHKPADGGEYGRVPSANRD